MGPERHGHVHGYGFDPTSARSSVLLVEDNSRYSCNITWKCSKASSNYRTKAYNYNWRTFTCERNIWRVVDKNSKEDTRKNEKRVVGKMMENAKTNANITSRTYDVDDATMSIKAIEFRRLCYIFIW